MDDFAPAILAWSATAGPDGGILDKKVWFGSSTFIIFSKTLLMYGLSMPGLAEWSLILVAIGVMWLVISTVISIAKNPQLEMTHKLLWVVIVVVAPILGSIVYHVFNKNLSSKS